MKRCNENSPADAAFVNPPKPQRHEMSLRPKPFAAIAAGEKTYELRLNDEKRQQISIGDVIVFSCTDGGETVDARVTSLHPFPDFAALYASLPLLKCGYTKENVHRASPDDMVAYYPAEKQAQYGVLGIGIERIRFPFERLSGSMEVQALTEQDVQEMLRLALGNPLYYSHMHMTPTLENLLETLTALPPRRTVADKHFFGWFREGRLIAWMDLILHHPREDMAFIGWLMVDAKEQGCGLGRSLVQDVLALLAEEGMTEVRLGRVAGNPQSEHFWRICGFEDNGLGYETEDYVVKVMSRKLI